ncbi:MAG: radical SAM/SPASM domain-containing protein [Nitrospinota bacterium]
MPLGKKIGPLFSPAHTTAQKFNLLMARFHWRFKHTRLLSYPIKLTIDPCNFCNLSCRLCPVGTGSKLREQSKMSFETFKKIIDECGKYLYWIDLFDWGEPLLNKDIFKMIRYARKFRAMITVSSNLNVLDDQCAENLIRSGLDKIVVSLDGTSQETVEKYQKGSDYTRVIRNMKKLISLRGDAKHPCIQWNFLVHSYNEHEVQKAGSMAKELGVDYLFTGPLRCSMGEEVLLDTRAQFENVKDWIPSKGSYSLYNIEKKEKNRIKKECNIPWFEAVIHPDGSVSPCCAVWPQRYDYGHMKNSSFGNVWNGRLYKEARKSIFNDTGSEAICALCKKNRAFI